MYSFVTFDEYMSEVVNNLGDGWIVTGNKNEYLVSHVKSITIATIVNNGGEVIIRQNSLFGKGLAKKIDPVKASEILKGWLRT